MKGYLEVEEARALPGLRLVLTVGVPGPWGEAAKGIFHAKGIPFARVAQRPGEANNPLAEWTGSRNAPVAVYDTEPARQSWTEILMLAERLAPTPPLLPADPRQRASVFGMGHELCGEMGFGWSRRLMLLHPVLRHLDLSPGAQIPRGLEIPVELGRRYGYSEAAAQRAAERVTEILGLFSAQLRSQRERGSEFLVGEALSALDIWWAAFAALLEPLPESHCAMSEGLRAGYTLPDGPERAAADPGLLAHREFIYREFLEYPLVL